MKTITYKDTQGHVVAQGVLGESVQESEGNYYFDREKVNFEYLTKKEDAYFCPIKTAQADYYYVKDEHGELGKQEACWIYEEIPNALYKAMEGKVGFYRRSTDEVTMEESE